MKKSTLLILLLGFVMLFVYAGCGGDSDDDNNNNNSDGDIDVVDNTDVPDGDTDGNASCPGVQPGGKNVGESCEELSDCYSGYCMTTEGLTSLGLDNVDMPNGYCTAWMIPQKDSCRCEPNGMWFSLLAWTGLEDVGICLVPCQDDSDCRESEGYKCFDPVEVFNDFSDYPSCVGTLYGGGIKGCLSETLINAAIAEPPDPESITCSE